MSGWILFRPDIRPLFTILFQFLTAKKPDNKNRIILLTRYLFDYSLVTLCKQTTQGGIFLLKVNMVVVNLSLMMTSESNRATSMVLVYQISCCIRLDIWYCRIPGHFLLSSSGFGQSRNQIMKSDNVTYLLLRIESADSLLQHGFEPGHRKLKHATCDQYCPQTTECSFRRCSLLNSIVNASYGPYINIRYPVNSGSGWMVKIPTRYTTACDRLTGRHMRSTVVTVCLSCILCKDVNFRTKSSNLRWKWRAYLEWW